MVAPKGAARRAGAQRARRTRRSPSAEVRRARIVVGAGILGSVVILAAWFPFTSLYDQHQALSEVAAQVARLDQENRALAQERAKLNTPAEIKRIARAQYDLVTNGATAYQVLPAPGKTGAGISGKGLGATTVVVPSGYSEVPSGTGPGGQSTPSATHPPTHVGLWRRILTTLEFWR